MCIVRLGLEVIKLWDDVGKGLSWDQKVLQVWAYCSESLGDHDCNLHLDVPEESWSGGGSAAEAFDHSHIHFHCLLPNAV